MNLAFRAMLKDALCTWKLAYECLRVSVLRFNCATVSCTQRLKHAGLLLPQLSVSVMRPYTAQALGAKTVYT